MGGKFVVAPFIFMRLLFLLSHLQLQLQYPSVSALNMAATVDRVNLTSRALAKRTQTLNPNKNVAFTRVLSATNKWSRNLISFSLGCSVLLSPPPQEFKLSSHLPGRKEVYSHISHICYMLCYCPYPFNKSALFEAIHVTACLPHFFSFMGSPLFYTINYFYLYVRLSLTS